MNIHMTLWEAAKRLAPSGDDATVRAFVGLLENAAKAGQIEATLEAEPRPLPVVIGGGVRRAEHQAPKTINWYSRVDFAEACLWIVTQGYKLPDNTLTLLPADVKAKVQAAGKVTTASEQAAQEAQAVKALSKAQQLLGLALIVLEPHIGTPALRHGKGINKAALLEKIIEKVQDADGEVPYGWKSSALADFLKEANTAAESLMKSRGQRLDSA